MLTMTMVEITDQIMRTLRRCRSLLNISFSLSHPSHFYYTTLVYSVLAECEYGHA